MRGHNRDRGHYRRNPNWIGEIGCKIEDATYISIGADKLRNALTAWGKYIHSDSPDRLVQLAIIHAEFESLHPFIDGNGRLGRMIVPLFMYSKGLIQSPVFYISAYLEANRQEYYDRLLAISRDGDWTNWCIFFLNAVEYQANENHQKAASILKLYEEMKPQMVELTHSQYAILALDWIFERPIFRSSDFVNRSGVSSHAAKRILRILKDKNVLEVIIEHSGRRSSVLELSKLLEISESY